MKAAVLRETGPAENLRLEEIADPQPGLQEVVVRLKATALNHRDVRIRHGGYARAPMKLPVILGSDGAGEVMAVTEQHWGVAACIASAPMGKPLTSENPMMTRIGLAGWSYADWKGRVYPSKPPRGFDPLEYLSAYFDTIEINSTFYRIPTVKTTRSWVARVDGNPAFRFTAKLPQVFTHTRQTNAQDEAAFKEAMAPLQDAQRLAALLLQFPYAFHQTPANRTYLQRLVERFRAYALVLEVRHRSWDTPDVYELLRELGVGFCNIDQPQVSYALGLTRQVTSEVGYLRLHGRNVTTWFQEDANRDARYDYLYSATELDEITAVLLAIAAQARETYLIANNHFRGQAALNALDIRRRVTRAPVNVPPQLLAVYPEMEQLIQPDMSSDV
jgi:uncharacterized protein YecE (DUF72 family)